MRPAWVVLMLLLGLGTQAAFAVNTFVATGGTVVSGYWNGTNTGGQADFVVPNGSASDYQFASLRIEVNSSGTYTAIGSSVSGISPQQSVSISRTDTEIETAGSFSDGDTFNIAVVFLDGNPSPSDTLVIATGITVDQTAPTAFTVGTVTTLGGNVKSGYWNSSNTSLDVTVPIASDASLDGGSLQIQGFVGANSPSDLGSSSTISIIGTNKTVSLAAATFNTETWFEDGQTFQLTAQLTDAAGNTTDGSASATTLSIDQTAPTISTVTSGASDGSYGDGDDISLTVTFTEAVTLSGGNFLTDLSSGAQLTTTTISNSATVSETYTVAEGETSSDLTVSQFSLSSGSATLLDAAGNDADLATISSNLGDVSAIVVDGVYPTVTDITSTTANGSYGVGDDINLTLTFSEAVTLSGGNLLVDIDASTADVTISTISSSTTATATYTVGSGDASSDLTVSGLSLSAGTFADAAGNAVNLALPGSSNLDDNKDIAVDGASPADFNVGSVVVTGGNVVSGAWNSSNTTLTVTIPIAADASLVGGTAQAQIFFGDISGAVDVGSATTISGGHLGSTLDIALDGDTDIRTLGGFTDGATLKVTAVLSDAGGNTKTGTQSSDTFDIDETAPSISSITSTTANGTYGIGNDVNVTLNFSENVTLSGGGNLLVDLNSGHQLSQSSLSAANTLSLTYTIVETDNSSDLAASQVSLSTGSTKLRDDAGNDASLSLPTSNFSSNDIVIDGIIPTVSSFTSTTADGTYGVGDGVNITVTFSEAVTLSGGNLQVDHDASTTDVDISSINSSTTAAVTYTVASGDASSDLTIDGLSLSAGTLQDAGGNDVDLTDLTGITENIATNSAIVIDGSAPAAFTLGPILLQGTVKSGGYWNATNTGLLVKVPIANDNTLSGGTVQVQGAVGNISGAAAIGSSSSITGGNLGDTVQVSLSRAQLEALAGYTEGGTMRFNAVLTDAGGNSTTGSASSFEFIIDETAPTISSITSSTADGTYGDGDDVDVTFNFSEDVSLSGGGNFVVNLNSGAQVTENTISGVSTLALTYTVAQDEAVADLAVQSVDLSTGTTYLRDDAGNDATLSLPTGNFSSNDIVIDGVYPNILSITSSTANGTYGEGDDIDITITFDETVTLTGGNLVFDIDASTSDVTLSSLSASNTASTTYTIGTGDASSDLTVDGLSLSSGTLVDAGGNSVPLSDLSGISNIADSKAIVVDGSAPAAFTLGTATAVTGNVVSAYWNATNQSITVKVPIANDASLDGGSVQVQGFFGSILGATDVGSAVSLTGGDLNDSLSVSLSRAQLEGLAGFTDGANLKLTAVITDAGGNQTTGTQSPNTFTIDEVDPTISSLSSTTSDGTYGVGDDINVTITFSEAVSISGGNLVTTLNSGTTLSTASISNTASLSQTYTISEGEEASDLDVIQLGLSSGGVDLWDVAGNAIDLTLPATTLADVSALVVDGVYPTVTTISSTSANQAYGVGDTINVTIDFSEIVTLSGGNLLVDLDASTTDLSISSLNANTVSATYTVASGDSSSDLTVDALSLSSGTLVDAGGNAVDLGDLSAVTNLDASNDISVDGAPPAAFDVGTTVAVGGIVVNDYWNASNTSLSVTVPIANDASLLAGGTLQIQGKVGSNPLADLGSASSIAAIGTDKTISIDNSVFEALTGFGEDQTVTIGAVLTDRFGNLTSSTTVNNPTLTIDQVTPTVNSLTSTTDDGDYGIDDVINVTVTLSEAVSLTSGSFSAVLNSGASDLTTSSVSATTTISMDYTIAQGEEAAPFNVTSLSATTNALRDAAGNVADLSLPVGNGFGDNTNINVYGILPTLLSITSNDPDGSYKLGDIISLRLTFDQAVYMSAGALDITFETGDVDQVLGVAYSSLTQGSATQDFDFTVTATDDVNPLDVLSLSPNGGSLVNAVGNNVDLTLPTDQNLSDNASLRVDGIIPAVATTGDIVTLGAPVVSNYFNEDNTGIQVIVPADLTDQSLIGGTVHLQGKAGVAAWEDIGSASTILTLGDKTLTVDRADIEGMTGYGDGVVILMRGVVTDAVGNATNGSQASNSLAVDISDPAAFSVAVVVPEGGDVFPGYWNPTNTQVSIDVPIANESSLNGGQLQLQAHVAGLSAEDLILPISLGAGDLGNTHNSLVANTVIQGITGYSDGDTLYFGAILTDVAGNVTTGTESDSTLIVDLTSPSADQVGQVIATGGVVVADYWNASNTGLTVTIPVASGDASMVGGTVQLQTSPDDVTYSDFLGLQSISNNSSDLVISVDAVDFEAIGYVEGDDVYFQAVVTDRAGNQTTFSTSSSVITIDQTAPDNDTTGDVVSAGGTVVDNYWNTTNTSLEVTVPFNSGDASILGGQIQLKATVLPDLSFDDEVGSAATIGDFTGTVIVSLSRSDLEALPEYADGGTLQLRADVQDAAGNETVYTASDSLIVIDQTNPGAFTTGALTVFPVLSPDHVWNMNSDSVVVAIPLAADATLEGGTIQVAMQVDANGYEEVGALTTIVNTGITRNIQVSAADIQALTGFTDGATLFARAAIVDRAGNSTTGNASTDSILIDVGPPADFSVSALTAVGGIVESGYYNMENSSISYQIPIADDATLNGGRAILTVDLLNPDVDVVPSDLSSYTHVDTMDISTVNTTLTASISHAQLQAIDGTLDDRVAIYVGAILEDAAGNQTESQILTDYLLTDFVAPSAFSVSSNTVIGGFVEPNYWNATNTGLELWIPIGQADTTLRNGFIQASLRTGVEPFDTLATIASIPILTDSVNLVLDGADMEAIHNGLGFEDGRVLDLFVTLYDDAGNHTQSTTLSDLLYIDQTAPTPGSLIPGGTTSQVYINADDTLRAEWDSFLDAHSGVNAYEYSIGNIAADSNVVDWTNLGTATSVADTLAVYVQRDQYFLNIRAADSAGNRSSILSTAGSYADLIAPVASLDLDPYYHIDQWSDQNSFAPGDSAFDEFSGVDHVLVNIRRESDDFFWTASGWVPDSTDLQITPVNNAWGYDLPADSLSNREDYRVTAMAVDSAANIQTPGAVASFQFVINTAPVIDAFADTLVLEEAVYVDTLTASDVDLGSISGDTLHYEIVSASDSVLLDSASGAIRWTPDDPDVGQHTFSFRVVDAKGESDTTAYRITVQQVNDAPYAVVPLEPADEFRMEPADSLLLTFRWREAFDVESDSVSYRLNLQSGSGYDTTLAVTDTVITLDVSIMDFPTVDPVNWYVMALDTTDTSAVDSVWQFYSSAPIAVASTDTVYNQLRRGVVADTSISLKNSGLTDLRWEMVEKPSWVNLPTTSGRIAFMDSVEISIDVNIATFNVGEWQGLVRLATNDPLQDTLDILIQADIYAVPTPVAAVYKNVAYPSWYELMIVDSLGMADTLTVTFGGDTLVLTEVDTFSYVSTLAFTTEGQQSVQIRAANWVGDTTITSTISVNLAKPGDTWRIASPDHQISLQGQARSLDHVQQIILLDHNLIRTPESRYAIYAETMELSEPALMDWIPDTSEQALYRFDASTEDYIEMPTIEIDGHLRSWTDRLGIFKQGPRTIIVPERTALGQNYPNPFNPSTTLAFDLGLLDGPQQEVSLKIFNLLGQEVHELVRGQLPAGSYQFQWNARDRSGRQLSSGVYFAVLQTDQGFRQTMKMLVLR